MEMAPKALRCLGKNKTDGKRCSVKTTHESKFCPTHRHQATDAEVVANPKMRARAHADDSDDESAASTAELSQKLRADAKDARFKESYVESAADAEEKIHNTRSMGQRYQLCFSYKTTMTGHKQTQGNGSNAKVTRTQTALQCDHGLRAHMRNGRDGLATQLRDVGVDVDTTEWWAEWMVACKEARLTVLFIDPDYEKSKACQKERNFVKDQKLPYLEIDDYMDRNPSDMAAMIQAHLNGLKTSVAKRPSSR